MNRWKAEPKDYQFEEAFQFSRDFEQLPSGLASNPFAATVATFKENLRRVILLGEMPLQLLFLAGTFERAICEARHDCGLAPNDQSKDQDEGYQEALSKRVQAYFGSDPQWSTRAVFDYGAHNLKFLLGPGHPGRAALEAVLAAMITSAYSAFETLAADLWVATVDMNFELAANVLREKQLPGNVMAGYGGDISKVGGRVLRDTKKVTFDSLSGIQDAYKQAFKGAISEPFDQELRHTEKVRHLIAHRAGLIDQKFKAEMSDYSEYERQFVGSRILLTGPIVRDRIDACVRSGVSLVRALDKWAVANPAEQL